MREAKQQIEEILDRAPCGIGLFEIGTSKPVFLNRAYYALVGYTKEEYAQIAGEQVDALILPQDLSASLQSRADFDKHGAATGYEYRIVRKGGGVLWIKFEVSTITLDGKEYAFCSFSDITKEHDSAAKLNLIAANANESISLFRVTPAGETLLFSNDRFYELLGVSREEYAVNGPAYDRRAVSQADFARTIESIKTAIMTGLPGELDYQIRQPGGKSIWARRRFVAVKQDDGSYLLISIVSDITEKKTRELLAELEQSRYELVVEELGAAVFEWNAGTGAFYASAGYSRYAMSRVDPTIIFANRGPVDMIHPDDADAMQQFFRETYSGKQKISTTLRMKMTDGNFRWCRMIALYYRDSDGKPTRTIGVLIDVNEEHEKSFMLNALINELPGGVAILRGYPNFDCRYFSDGFAKLSGRTRAEVDALISSGKLLESTVAPSDYNRFIAVMRKATHSGDDINITYRYIKKSGQVAWLHLTANRMSFDGDTPVYYCVFTIPTEESLLYRSLVKDSSTGVFVGERKTQRVLYMNDLCAKLAGGEYHHDGTDQTLEDVLAKGRHHLVTQEQIDSLSHDHYSEFHLDFPHYYLVVMAKAMVWNGVDAFVLYISDETNEHRQWLALQHQAEVEQAAEKAIRDTNAKGEFLSRMSHDMRTPMNGILGLAELSEDETDIAVLKENMAKIKESGKYLLGLINDTLDYQRIETGRLQLDPQIVDAHELLESVLSIIRLSAEQKGVNFRMVKYTEEVNCKLRIDPMRYKEILLNILSNAIKFTPAGGTVELGFRRLAPQGTLACYEITVTDTGIGMSEDFLKNRLFKPFSQENNAVTSVYAGSGLGLSIAKSLVELMGGNIAVESELGAGTKFTITLSFERIAEDAVEESVQDSHESVEAAKRAINGKQILLAEDHPLNAEIASRLLQKVGCRITWVQNGQECVDTFLNSAPGQFDAILMDIRMPVMNGLEATTVIRSMERADAKAIPILAMTANAYAEDIAHSRAVGMNAHLSKPIVPDVLYTEIAKTLH